MTASSSNTIPQGSLPPANPLYILRGHTSPVHSLTFFSRNRYLISGDADGWLVVWSTTSKRASAVWKAHGGSVMGLNEWRSGDNEGRVVSQGRDHKLRVWQLRENDLEILDKRLPAEDTEMHEDGPMRREPWLLYSLDVNALNFCAFRLCYDEPQALAPDANDNSDDKDEAPKVQKQTDKAATTITTLPPTRMTMTSSPSSNPKPILVATANALSSGAIDIFHLPSSRRITTIPVPKAPLNAGMLMAVDLAFTLPSHQEGNTKENAKARAKQLTVAAGYESGHVCVHMGQAPPLLSFSSSEITENPWHWHWQTIYTSHPHSQPVLSLAIDPFPSREWFISSAADALIAKHPFHQQQQAQPQRQQQPLKTINTKHAGQQGLAIRDDGRVLATAGWDKRVRVYGAKGLKELAVLKWHREGCYAVAFADVLPSAAGEEEGLGDRGGTSSEENREDVSEVSALTRIRDARMQRAQSTHWLATGGKDGKISMWEVY